MQINNIEICVKISDSTINFNKASYPCQVGIEGGIHYHRRGVRVIKKLRLEIIKYVLGFIVKIEYPSHTLN